MTSLIHCHPYFYSFPLLFFSAFLILSSRVLGFDTKCPPLQLSGLLHLKGGCSSRNFVPHGLECTLVCLDGSFVRPEYRLTQGNASSLKCLYGNWFLNSLYLYKNHVHCHQNETVQNAKRFVQAHFDAMNANEEGFCSLDLPTHLRRNTECELRTGKVCEVACESGVFSARPQSFALRLVCVKKDKKIYYSDFLSDNQGTRSSFLQLDFPLDCNEDIATPKSEVKSKIVFPFPEKSPFEECTCRLRTSVDLSDHFRGKEPGETSRPSEDTTPFVVPFEISQKFLGCLPLVREDESFEYYRCQRRGSFPGGVSGCSCFYACKPGYRLGQTAKSYAIDGRIYGLVSCAPYHSEEPDCIAFDEELRRRREPFCGPVLTPLQRQDGNILTLGACRDSSRGFKHGDKCDLRCSFGNFLGTVQSMVQVICNKGSWQRIAKAGEYSESDSLNFYAENLRCPFLGATCEKFPFMSVATLESCFKSRNDPGLFHCTFRCNEGRIALPFDLGSNEYSIGRVSCNKNIWEEPRCSSNPAMFRTYYFYKAFVVL